MTKLNINESHYLNLRASAPARLAVLRNAAAYTNAHDVKLPPSMRFATWREARRTTFRTLDTGLAQGFNSCGSYRVPVWYSHSSAEHFRNERKAHNIVSMNHTGWYADIDGLELITGIVAGLPHGRFIAGYECSENEERVYFSHIYDDENDAARAADEHARIQADKEREQDQRYNDACNLAHDVEMLKTDVAELFPMRHHGRARRELAQTIETMRTKRATLASEYADIEL